MNVEKISEIATVFTWVVTARGKKGGPIDFAGKRPVSSKNMR